MDYIDGESLAKRVKRQGAMSESEALQVLNGILDALSAVHAAGLTHLDIKPDNIMLDKAGKVYLIDFGASKQMTTEEQKTVGQSAFLYTEGYAPSELLEKNIKKIGPWTDLYAVGATLYRILTNQPIPMGSEIISYVYSKGEDPFHLPNDITQSTQSIIKWLMHPSKDSRPQSAAEVLSKLKEQNVVASSVVKETTDKDATVYDSEIEAKINSKKNSALKQEEKYQNPEEVYDKDSVGLFFEGFAKVKGYNGKYGFIDKTGKLVIPCRWKEALIFSGGMAAVKDSSGLWGYIDKNGNNVIRCQWQAASNFTDGTAKVQNSDGGWIEIDETGRKIKGYIQVDGGWIEIDETGRKIKGYIQVQSEPQKASVAIDGKWIGFTPGRFEVTPGEHEMKIAKGAEWSVYTRNVKLYKGQTVDVYATLEKKSYIEVKSEPSGAFVFIDGSKRGSTPGKFEVSLGKHEVKVKKDDDRGYFTQTVQVNSRQTVNVFATLEKKC